MTLRTALLTTFITAIAASPAFAQTAESPSGPGKVEASIIPGGGIFFTEGKDTHSPSFGNYDLGGSVTVNFNRYVGVEGEVSGGLGVSQSLDFAGTSLPDTRTPHLLNYSGNLVVQAGWQWRPARNGQLLRLGLQYYNGKSNQFEFYNRNENKIGMGVWYDY